jgi:hypothetical protein
VSCEALGEVEILSSLDTYVRDRRVPERMEAEVSDELPHVEDVRGASGGRADRIHDAPRNSERVIRRAAG